jgi:hypothetical protein
VRFRDPPRAVPPSSSELSTGRSSFRFLCAPTRVNRSNGREVDIGARFRHGWARKATVILTPHLGISQRALYYGQSLKMGPSLSCGNMYSGVPHPFSQSA